MPISESHPLRRWANSLRAYYGHPVYMIGSQLNPGVEHPHDIDVVCILPDDEFALRYGPLDEWMEQGLTGAYHTTRWRWAREMHKRWREGVNETHLPIDFKVYPMAQHRGYANLHAVVPPYRLDTFTWAGL